MAAYRLVDDLWSPAGCLPVHRDQLLALRSLTSMGSLYLFYCKIVETGTAYAESSFLAGLRRPL